jgi:hypothetical protein
MATTTDNERLITLEEIEEVLPLTQGDGSIYRKDETGHVNKEKVTTGAEKARVSFKMSMPKLSSPDFKTFISAAKQIAETGTIALVKTYSDSDIDKVKTGGITGAIANEMIKKKYGQK